MSGPTLGAASSGTAQTAMPFAVKPALRWRRIAAKRRRCPCRRRRSASARSWSCDRPRDAAGAAKGFTPAVTTEGGKIVWLGGQTASLPPSPDFDTQVRDVFAQLEKTLKAQGGSLKDIVTMTAFITDARNGDRFVALRKEILKECFPASALITITGLAVPGLQVEVQGIAVIGGK